MTVESIRGKVRETVGGRNRIIGLKEDQSLLCTCIKCHRGP